jgi:peptidoglycan/LPS O-acetylase OafA/YrhL
MEQRRDIPCLTGVRFLAALLVVIVHTGRVYRLPEFLVNLGRPAVSFFFILSGVVLTYNYRDAISSRIVGWWDFLNLRLARIMPMHIATWFLATVYVWYGWKPAQGDHPVVSWILGLFCLQSYWPSADIIGRWNAVAWSNSCELFFYALFPFLLPVLVRRLRSTRSIIIAMIGTYLLQVVLYKCASGTLVRLITPAHSFLGYQTHGVAPAWVIPETITVALLVFPPLRLFEFVVGMCIGLLILRGEPLFKSALKANLLLGFCIIAFVLLIRLPAPNWMPIGADTYLIFVPVLALTLVVLASGLTVITPVLDSRLAILLGNASYALYLIHPFLSPDRHATRLVAVLYVLGDIVAAIVLSLVLERPARRLWRHVFRRRRNPSYKPVGRIEAA